MKLSFPDDKAGVFFLNPERANGYVIRLDSGASLTKASEKNLLPGPYISCNEINF